MFVPLWLLIPLGILALIGLLGLWVVIAALIDVGLWRS